MADNDTLDDDIVAVYDDREAQAKHALNSQSTKQPNHSANDEVMSGHATKLALA